MRMDRPHLPSLVDHFNPPRDHTGCFGWIMGYSADAHFLNEAAERFVGETKGQRRYTGQIRLAVMLDPGMPQITPVETPGVLHLLYQKLPHPFRLLHAKVAILGFRHESQPDQWCVRLIVSTGNWTRQTLEESLDLVWVVEARPDFSGAPEDAQVCADLTAAWDLFAHLRKRFDTRALQTAFTSQQVAALDLRMQQVRKNASGAPRFFDSRTASLFDQLPRLVNLHAGTGARNYLSLGSGFYEHGDAALNVVPKVPGQIVENLLKAQLLTAKAEVALTVEPDSCQAIAGAQAAIRDKDWSIRGPWTSKVFQGRGRRLHAKFIFSASVRVGKCLRPWVYLGSGNLTPAGFMKPMGPSGNLEAGVVFAPRGLEWGEATVERDGQDTILPVRWDKEIEPADLQSGESMPERPEPIYAPPIAWLDWKPRHEGGGHLTPPETSLTETSPTERFDVLSFDAQPCAREGDAFVWPAAEPSEVTVVWGETGKAVIPVRNPLGMLARGPLPALKIDEAIHQLQFFPQPPESEETGDEDIPLLAAASSTGQEGPAGQAARSPIRQMMQLIEHIADCQTGLPAAHWPNWLVRLESTLQQMADDQTVSAFRDLELNPLAPLLEPPFRPDFAENPESNEGRAYEFVIGRIAEKWRVAGMAGLGEVK